MSEDSTTHATAVLIGAHAVLIRGPAGSGKSQFALALIEAAKQGHLPFARLVADDRVALENYHGRLLARAPATLAGLIEVRGLGIRRMDYETIAAVGLIVDLAAADAERLPAPTAREAEIAEVRLPRLAVGPQTAPLPVLLALLRTRDAGAG